MSDEKCLFVMKNDHFLKLCHEGQLEPPVSDEKCLFVTKNDHFLKLCHEGQLDHPVSTFSFAPKEVGWGPVFVT